MVIARSIFVVHPQQIPCDKRVALFFSNKRRKLCFDINLLNNKTIILLNLAEYRLISANSANGLVG